MKKNSVRVQKQPPEKRASTAIVSSEPKTDNSAMPDVGADSLRQAITAPSARTLSPAVVNSLQATHGNHFVARLVSRARAPRPPVSSRLQRGVLTVAAKYKTDDEIRALTLEDFQTYAGAQIDWAKDPSISDVSRGYLQALLEFARWPDILSGCGTMKIKSLIDFGLVKIDGTLDDTKFEALKTYSKAVSGSAESVKIKAPTNIPRKAVQWGTALDQLLTAPGINATQIRIIMPQAEFEQLLAKNYLADFANYVNLCSPRLEAPDGVEIRSYLALRAEGKDPVAYQGTSIDGKVRNFHRFQRAALDRLVANFNVSQPDAAKRKPLTLILHTALDHNGAFHRDGSLTAVITDTRILTLMIEGPETLDEVQNELGPLALKYGKDNKIDQAMFAGHGNAQSIELGGQNKFTKATATKDAPPQDDDFLDLHKDDEITVIDIPQAGLGKGSLNGKDGYFWLKHTSLKGDPKATSQGINLDPGETLDESNALFDELLKNMANDPAIAPHRRIVFNACLTNSNAVHDPLDPDPKAAAQEVRDHIDANSSLAFYLQKRAKAQGMNNISVLGANGSIGEVRLIDKKTAGLDIISTPDPKVTAPKMVYVAEGQEPQGVLRAVLECWAGVGMTTEVDQQKSQADCFAAMTKRIKTAPASWAQTIINEIFSLILAKYKTNGEMIRLFADAAGNLDELQHDAECRVSKLKEVGLGPAGKLSADAEAIFGALTKASLWKSTPQVPLVVNQVWMLLNNAKESDFMASMASFNCQTADQFLDIKSLTSALPALLPLTPTPSHSQLLLAFRVVDTDNGIAAAKDFLLNVADKSAKRFPTALKVGAILQGKPNEQIILEKIGLGAGSGVVAGSDVNANFDLDGDGKNETYIEPLPGMRGITLTDKKPVFQKPDATSTKIGKELAKDSRVIILGQITDFYAIDLSAAPSRVAFIEKADVLPL